MSFFNTEAAKKAAAIPNAPIRILPEEIRSIETIIEYITFLEQEEAAAKEELQKAKVHPGGAKAIRACGFVIGENGDEYSVNLVARKIVAGASKAEEGIDKEESQSPQEASGDEEVNLNPGRAFASQGMEPAKNNDKEQAEN